MKKYTKKGHQMAWVRIFFMIFMTFLVTSSCSDDEPTTGSVRIEVTHLPDGWSKDEIYVLVKPIEYENITIKEEKIKFGIPTTIDLNPGNYYIYVVSTYGSDYKEIHQIQIGKTVEIKI